ncbi:MAG: hypothetical protein M1830_005112 [Pleopsidium flavum]|nr:MAG: hypothetical protein M1830_005112 [Pleopsidium flavum]
MENDAVFVAEANVDHRLRESSPFQHNEQDLGVDAVTSASGGVAVRKDVDYEDTPLLSRIDDDVTSEESGHDERPRWSGERDFEGKTWWNKPSVFWLLPPFLLFTLAFGGVVVPKLNLILTLICQEYLSDRSNEDPSFQFMPVIVGSDNPQCQIPEVQALVSKFTLYGNLIAGILSAITSPKLGALSDRYGRRNIIAMTTVGMLIGEIITIIAATYPEMFSVKWLLLGYAFDGLCGSFIAAMALTHSYAADCTPPAKRNVTFGYFHGCLYTGIAIGPVIAGYIIKATGEILTIFYIALGCHFIFLSFLLFVVPESLSKERQMAAREKHRLYKDGRPRRSFVNALKGANLLAPLEILYPTGEGSSRAVRWNLMFLAAVDTTMFGVAMGSMTVVVIYSEYMFGWGNLESSIFVSIVNTCRVCVLLIFVPLITRFIRGRAGSVPQRNSGCDRLDLAIIRTAIVFDILGYIGYATVRTGSLLILSGAIAAVGGMGSPTLQSSLTKHVPPDRTGQLLGATGLLHALARVVAPTIFNLIYALTVGKFTQTVFVCLAATFGVAFILSWFIRPHVYFDEPDAPRLQSRSGGDIDSI